MRLRTLCLYPCAPLVSLIAVLAGFLSRAHIPEGRLFATVIPLANGYLPATVVGDAWWESRTPTPRVPADLTPAKRPVGETFAPLLGTGDEFPMLGLGLTCIDRNLESPSLARRVSGELI
jgi:hypothetical protein